MRESHPARPSRSLLVVGAALLTATLAASLGTAPASSGDGGQASKGSSVSAERD
ncbi:hypothetical protein [Streptomyces chryseus]|uniref:Uncharacterized protein n=1 Tax=Streptomyces chryseus TaxID=68186 RepID=A0ABQ3DYL9_9ACTN|nr:hypothetical protein [Streptomyces chryseus]GHB19162.1 hypothetical protein GCM10010346_48840 [Streptomyces chryseus]